MSETSVAPVVLSDDRLTLTCLPEQGATITGLVDRASGADALWRRAHTPAPCSRALGPSGPASVITFSDVFIGGWFDMLPIVGFPTDDVTDPSNLLHGEMVRLPWEREQVEATRLVCGVRCVRVPLALVREIELDGTGGVAIATRITNEGGSAVPYLWGLHPCFDRAVFAGGRIELDVEDATVPEPAMTPGVTRLPLGTQFTWPWVGEPAIDVAAIPDEPTGSQDHVLFKPRTPRLRLTAPRHGLEFTMEWDLETFPHLLMFQDFRSPTGWMFWGEADFFAIEPSTNPGRSVEDAVAADAIQELAPGETVATTALVRWQPEGGE